MTKIPAIIAARGGSRRLPRKNVLSFCGRPLVEWTIIQARNSHRISEVWVTTDDAEIKQIALRNGALVIDEREVPNGNRRPTAAPAILNAVDGVLAAGRFDTFLSILPTGVCWKPDDFDRGVEMYFDLGAVYLGPKHNPRECYVNERLPDNRMRRVIFGKNFEFLTQGEQWVVADVGYYRRRCALLPDTEIEANARLIEIEQNTVGAFHYYPIEWWQQFDVDDWNDFCMQEFFMQKYILDPLGGDCYERYGQERDRQGE